MTTYAAVHARENSACQELHHDGGKGVCTMGWDWQVLALRAASTGSRMALRGRFGRVQKRFAQRSCDCPCFVMCIPLW